VRKAAGQIMDELTKRSAFVTPATFTRAEILGRQTQAAAVELAQRWADMWQATVNLYCVPFVSYEKQWRIEDPRTACAVAREHGEQRPVSAMSTRLDTHSCTPVSRLFGLVSS
jgi:hypothetical protein